MGVCWRARQCGWMEQEGCGALLPALISVRVQVVGLYDRARHQQESICTPPSIISIISLTWLYGQSSLLTITCSPVPAGTMYSRVWHVR
jgi:hypothetical protein